LTISRKPVTNPIRRDGERVGEGVADDPLGGRLPQMGEQLRLAVEEDPDLTGNAGVLFRDRLGGDRVRDLAPHVCEHVFFAGVEEPREHERIAEADVGKAGQHGGGERQRQDRCHHKAHAVADDGLEFPPEERGELAAEAGDRDRREGCHPVRVRSGRRSTSRGTVLLRLRHPTAFGLPLPPAGRPEAAWLVFDGDVHVGQPMHSEVSEGLDAGAEPHHLAVAKDQEFAGLVHVVEMVRDRDHGRAGPRPFGQERHDPGLGGWIEAGCRLVHHEQARSGEQLRRQARPLHLASREAADRPVPHLVETDLGDRPVDGGPALRGRRLRR
jgi:hypothetical protein